MTRMTSFHNERALIIFAGEAATDFAENPKHQSFGDIYTPGSLIALRWGLDKDCVLVIKLDEYWENVNFQNCVEVKL